MKPCLLWLCRPTSGEKPSFTTRCKPSQGHPSSRREPCVGSQAPLVQRDTYVAPDKCKPAAWIGRGSPRHASPPDLPAPPRLLGVNPWRSPPPGHCQAPHLNSEAPGRHRLGVEAEPDLGRPRTRPHAVGDKLPHAAKGRVNVVFTLQCTI